MPAVGADIVAAAAFAVALVVAGLAAAFVVLAALEAVTAGNKRSLKPRQLALASAYTGL